MKSQANEQALKELIASYPYQRFLTGARGTPGRPRAEAFTTGTEGLGRGATDHERLRTTDLYSPRMEFLRGVAHHFSMDAN